MSSALITWLVHSTVLVTVVCIILLLAHRRILKLWGSGTAYSLWLLVPLALILPLFCQLFGYLIWWANPQSALANTQLSLLLRSTFSYTSINAEPDTLLNDGNGAQWLYAVIVVWLMPAISLLGIYCYHLLQSARAPLDNLCGLSVEYIASGNSPALVGLFRPHIQLPEDFEHRFSSQQRRLMLTHEISHWRNGDLGYNAIAWLCLSMQWFNPLAWLAYSRFRADQELACDARVLRKRAQSSPHLCYANALMATLQYALPKARRGGTGSAIRTQYGHRGDKHMYQERIKQLRDTRQTRMKPVLVTMTCASLIAGGWLIPAAAASHQISAHLSAASAAAPTANNTENDNRPITPVVRINPRYPADAAAQGIEGHVDFEIIIDQNGEVSNVEVLNAEPQGIFEEEAMTALKRWRFVPQNNVHHRLRIEFSLGTDES